MQHRRISNKISGFTLIELMVTISIISLLSSIVLASLSSARDKGRVTAVQEFSTSVYHGLGDQLIAWWKFDEGSNTSVADASGNGHTGTLINGVTWVTGQVGPYAINTNTPSYPISQMAVTSIPLGSNWTASWWSYFPLATFNGSWRTMFRSVSNGGADHQVIVNPTGYLGMFDNDIDFNFHTTGYNVSSLNGWHLVTATYTGGITTFYIDTAIVGKVTQLNTDNIDTIGNYQGGGQNWGIIDDLRIYGNVITSEALQKQYADGIARHIALSTVAK